MTKAAPLTMRQTEVFAFIRMHHRLTDSMPTCSDIAQHFGFASPNAAHEHIRALERKGYVHHITARHRGIKFAAGFSPYDEIKALMLENAALRHRGISEGEAA